MSNHLPEGGELFQFGKISIENNFLNLVEDNPIKVMRNIAHQTQANTSAGDVVVSMNMLCVFIYLRVSFILLQA